MSKYNFNYYSFCADWLNENPLSQLWNKRDNGLILLH